jgi:hypothetical protein
MTKIVVSSNCMTGGLVAALSLLQPDSQFVPIPRTIEDVETLGQTLSGSDYWLVSGLGELNLNCHEFNPDLKIVEFPELYFDAFHPDQVYAWLPDRTLAESATGPYHSAVVLWAWRRELSVEQTKSLFRSEVFEALGYHDRWGSSINRLSQLFETFQGINHNDFLQPLIRRGAFMHTVNHPKISAICSLARLLASAIRPAAHPNDEPIEDVLLDSLFLASFSWPVYPSIANALGTRGSFLWKLEDHSVIGLDQFIELSFAHYATQNLEEIDCHQLQWPIYDQVLPGAS